MRAVPECGAAAFPWGSAAALATLSAVGGTIWERANTEPASVCNAAEADTAPGKGRGYVLGVVPIFLAVPFFHRATFRTEVVPNSVWTFEQRQGIGLGLNTAVNVRMTAVRIKATGGLLLYSPVAPTGECVALVKELGGDVEHIVLGTTLFEHQQFFAPMCRAFPDATPHAAKGQWAWPIDVYSPVVGGLPGGRSIKACEVTSDEDAPLPRDFECLTLDLPPVGLDARLSFTELAVFHRPSRTLLVTDAVVSVPRDPPLAISQRDVLEWADDRNTAITGLRTLGLFGVRGKARDYGLKSARARVRETSVAAAERLGWMRMCLTALYFGQRDVLRPEASFGDLVRPGLLVPPVLGTLVYGDGGNDDAGAAAYDWAEDVARRFPFARVIPAHLAIVERADRRAWLRAFEPFRRRRPSGGGLLDLLVPPRRSGGAARDENLPPATCYPPSDAACLRSVRRFLVDVGVIFVNASRPARTPR